MTWEIVAGLIVLVGFGISICTIVSNNTKAMTEVKCSIDELNRSMTKQENDFNSIKIKVEDHEIRLSKIEFEKE